jgi:hypothetical protein
MGVRKVKEVEDRCVFAFDLAVERFEWTRTTPAGS